VDEIDKSKVYTGNWIYVIEVIDVSQWWRKNNMHQPCGMTPRRA
jgi:hypothetical protein